MTKEIKDRKTKSGSEKKEQGIRDLMGQARTTADAERPIPGGCIPGGCISGGYISDDRTPKLPARKKPFPLPAPSSFVRTGPAYLPADCHIHRQDLLDLGFKGVEFGLWMSDGDVQAVMDDLYNALCDLAHALDIDKRDISLGGTLSLSFGARGHGQSAAAYDPDQQVISLPKGNGAGFLAHAWAHALDDFLGRTCRIHAAHGPAFLLWAPYSSSVPRSVEALFQALRYRPVSLSPEQQARILKDRHGRSVQKVEDRFWDRIRSITPGPLDDRQRAAWDRAVQYAYDERYRARLEMYSGPNGQNGAVEGLSALHKTITGHVLPRQERSRLNYILADLYLTERSFKPPGELLPQERPSQMEPTDYLEGSQKMDEQFARTRHGRHSDTCEMFARTFDCYVADKLRAGGISDPYLTAHAESFVFSDGNGKRIYAVPMGDERRQIFQRYDRMILDLKELGLLHGPDGIEKSPAPKDKEVGPYAQKASISDIHDLISARKIGMVADTAGRQGTGLYARALRTRGR